MRARRKLAAVSIALAVTAIADAQVFKCVDKSGRVTYQSQPCPDAPKQERLDINLGSRPGVADVGADPWAEQVGKKVVVSGMPRATVMRALGSPTQMRAGTAVEDAAEVWVYRRPDMQRRIGFRSGVVSWIKDGDEEPAGAPVRMSRKAVVRGMQCGSLTESLGPADSILTEPDAELGKPVMRYTFPSMPPENETTIVFCDDGVVARVDRVLDN